MLCVLQIENQTGGVKNAVHRGSFPVTLFLAGARIFIGMDPEYQRRQDVEIQSELAVPGREIFYSMPDLITAVRASIRYATN